MKTILDDLKPILDEGTYLILRNELEDNLNLSWKSIQQSCWFKEDKKFQAFLKTIEYFGETSNYVILKEDENGKYVEYAFMDGEPERNRVLHRYIATDFPTNRLYKLRSATCGDKCKVGEPNPDCYKKREYNEKSPDCCCWRLEIVRFEEGDLRKLTFEDFWKISKLMWEDYIY